MKYRIAAPCRTIAPFSQGLVSTPLSTPMHSTSAHKSQGRRAEQSWLRQHRGQAGPKAALDFHATWCAATTPSVSSAEFSAPCKAATSVQTRNSFECVHHPHDVGRRRERRLPVLGARVHLLEPELPRHERVSFSRTRGLRGASWVRPHTRTRQGKARGGSGLRFRCKVLPGSERP